MASETRTSPTVPDAKKLEALSAELHAIYQKEARRQAGVGDDEVRHPDDYDALPEHTKEYDRVLARFILQREAQTADYIEHEPIWTYTMVSGNLQCLCGWKAFAEFTSSEAALSVFAMHCLTEALLTHANIADKVEELYRWYSDQMELLNETGAKDD